MLCHRKKTTKRQSFFYGRGERTQTFDLSVPNRARYQLRHTPKRWYLGDYTLVPGVFLVVFTHQLRCITIEVMNKTLLATLEKYWWVTAIAAGGLAASLALLLSAGQPIWFDEGYSILLAREPVGELLALTAVDAHPPFYYLVLKAWGELFGFTEVALRSLSAVMLGGAVMMMLVLVRRLFGARVMVVSTLVLVLAPFALRYGYEVRMYAMASLIGIAATYALVRARESTNNAWWVLYASLVALGMYTLYMTLAVWVAHVVWLVWLSLRDKKRQPIWRWKWVYAFVGAIVLFAPYIPTFFYQLKHSALPGIGQQVTLTSIVDMTTMTSLFTAEWAVGGWLSLVLAVMTVAIIVAAVRVFKRLPASQLPSFVLILAMVIVPVLFFAVSSLPPRPPVYVIRYIAHVALFMYILVAIILGLYWTRVKGHRLAAPMMYIGVLAILCVGVANLSRTGNFNFERMQDPHTAELRTTVECTNDTVVVADDPYTYIDSIFYYDDCDARFFSEENVARAGGYAMLHDSTVRVAQASEVTSKHIVHLRWTGNEPKFTPSDRYRLVHTGSMDKQIVDTYELIEE